MISVIIPVYNAATTIERTVESVLSQDGIALQLILVNDGSSDNSGVICDKLAENDKRIISVHKENGGVSSARNCGIDNAEGELICFVDADDILLPNALASMKSVMIKNNVDLVISDYEEFLVKQGKHNTIICPYPHNIVLNKEYISNTIFHDLYCNYTVGISNLWNKLFRKSIIKKNVLSFDIERTHGEDWAFVMDYLMICSNLYFLSNTVYSYHVDGSQTLSKYKKGLIRSITDRYQRLKLLKDNGSFTLTKQEKVATSITTIEIVINFLKMYPNNNDILTLRHNRQIRLDLQKIILINNRLLLERQHSRRIKLVALLIYLGMYQSAIKQYNRGCIK